MIYNMRDKLQETILNKLLEYNETDLLTQKEDQLKRLTDYINSDPIDDDIDELNELKAELENEIAQLKQDNRDNTDFTNRDLEKMLSDAKELFIKLVGRNFIEENDTNPSIVFGNTGRDKLGYCQTSMYRDMSDISTNIIISNILKQFTEHDVMNTVIHEYIHSLKCCLNVDHFGKWRELSELVNKNTDYNITAVADSSESESFDSLYDKGHKTVYHVICNNCGYEYKHYTANADIVKHPENYSHRCPDGTKGTFKIDIEKR